MSAIAMPNQRSNPAFLCLFLAFIIVAAITAGLLFSASRHVESTQVRDAYRNGKCDKVEHYYSLRLGTMLALCHKDGHTNGIVYRITENMGKMWLEHPYEATAFTAEVSYWSGVLVRDGYSEPTDEVFAQFIQVLPEIYK